MIQPGYVFLETHADRPELLRLGQSAENPLDKPAHGAAKLRYVARFNDVEAGFMHAHEAMHRKLKDINTHLYRVELAEAIADIRTIELKHEVIWVDESINATEAEIEAYAERNRHAQQRRNLFVRIIIVVTFTLLILNFIAPLLPGFLS